jgi:hypothetical protein
MSQLARLAALAPNLIASSRVGRRCQATLAGLGQRSVLLTQAKRTPALDNDDTARQPGRLFRPAVTVSWTVNPPTHVNAGRLPLGAERGSVSETSPSATKRQPPGRSARRSYSAKATVSAADFIAVETSR